MIEPPYLSGHLLASGSWIPWQVAAGIMALVFVGLPLLIVFLIAKFAKHSPVVESASDQFTNRDWLLMGIAIIGSGVVYSVGPDLWYHSLLTCAVIGFGVRCVLWGTPQLDKRRRWWALTLLGSLALTQCITFVLMLMGQL